MTAVTQKEADILVSVYSVGALEAAHTKALLEAIDANTGTAAQDIYAYLYEGLLDRLVSFSVLSKVEADLIAAAIAIRAPTGQDEASIGDATVKENTRRAIRRLYGVLSYDTTETLVELLVD